MSYHLLDAGELSITIHCKDAKAEQLVSVALADLQLSPINESRGLELQLEFTANDEWWLIDEASDFDRKLAQDGDLIYHLSDRLIFHLADKIEQRHCLHAAAVQVAERACVIPAKSGAGKSSLTAWLVANQFRYVTDELILIDDDEKITGVARPIQIKSRGLSVVEPLLTDNRPIYAGSFANAITVDHLGGQVAAPEAIEIGLFLFPQYDADAHFSLTRLSSAEAGLQLMSNHVNARNIKGHGFRAMMKLIRETPCYALSYGGYDKLPKDFSAQLRDISR